MKQEYSIFNNNKTNELIIRESVETSKEILSLVCEEKYNSDDIKSAIAKGSNYLIAVLRTKNMCPVELYAIQLAALITEMYKNKNEQSVKLFFDDAASFSKEREDFLNLEDVEEKGPDPDELIEDNNFDKSKILKNNFSIKIADDDAGDDEIDFEEEV